MLSCGSALSLLVTGSKSWEEVVPWGAFVAGLVALGVAGWNQLQTRRDRRRTLYSEAYRAGLAWTELYYRVRRRKAEDPYELVRLFHEAQEEITYHEGWLATESRTLGAAYAAFVTAVKDETRPRIQKAWADPPCDPDEGLEVPDGEHPHVEAAKQKFVGDVRDHLSPWPWDWHALGERYPTRQK